MRKVPEQVFAVVRLDAGAGSFEERVTVKEIVTSLELALDEVARLNTLNSGKGASISRRQHVFTQPALQTARTNHDQRYNERWNWRAVDGLLASLAHV